MCMIKDGSDYKDTLGCPQYYLVRVDEKRLPFICDVYSVVTDVIFLLSGSKTEIDLMIKDELSA
jgi:hypothetical protein